MTTTPETKEAVLSRCILEHKLAGLTIPSNVLVFDCMDEYAAQQTTTLTSLVADKEREIAKLKKVMELVLNKVWILEYTPRGVKKDLMVDVIKMKDLLDKALNDK